jgi:hypothetical protein
VTGDQILHLLRMRRTEFGPPPQDERPHARVYKNFHARDLCFL